MWMPKELLAKLKEALSQANLELAGKALLDKLHQLHVLDAGCHQLATTQRLRQARCFVDPESQRGQLQQHNDTRKVELHRQAHRQHGGQAGRQGTGTHTGGRQHTGTHRAGSTAGIAAAAHTGAGRHRQSAHRGSRPHSS